MAKHITKYGLMVYGGIAKADREIILKNSESNTQGKVLQKSMRFSTEYVRETQYVYLS